MKFEGMGRTLVAIVTGYAANAVLVGVAEQLLPD
jgi:hypothetical protein